MSSPPPQPPQMTAAPPQAPGPGPIPWEERARLGLGTALVGTVELFALRPREGFLRARRTGDLLSPVLWVAIMAFLGALLRFVWGLVVQLPLEGMLGGGRGEMAQLALITGGGFIGVFTAPITAVAVAFIMAGILHGCLMLMGGLDRTQLGYEGSLRAVAYAEISQLACIVPLAGSLIAMVWGVILIAFGLEALHDTSFGRALAATLIPLLTCCLCGALLAALFGAAIAGLLQHAG